MRVRGVGPWCLLVLVGLVASCTGDDVRPVGEVPASSAAPARAEESWVDGLPTGEPRTVAYRVGRRLVLDGAEVRLPHEQVDLVGGFGVVVVRDARSGRVTAYRTQDGQAVVLARASRGVPVLVSGGANEALVPAAGPSPRVDLVGWRFGPGRRSWVEDSQTFPVPCCAGRFAAIGMSQFREVVVDTADGPWLCDSAEGQEGVPYDVPDSDAYVRALEEPPGTRLVHADASFLYFRRPPREAGGPSAYVVRLSPESVLRWAGAPRPTPVRGHEVHVEAGPGTLLVRAADGGPLEVVDPMTGTARRLPLPPGTRAAPLGVEHPRHLLLDVTDLSGVRGLVRCDLRDRRCERAARLPQDAVLPRPAA